MKMADDSNTCDDSAAVVQIALFTMFAATAAAFD